MSATDIFGSIDRTLAEAREQAAQEAAMLRDQIHKLEIERDFLRKENEMARSSEAYWQRIATKFTTQFATVQAIMADVAATAQQVETSLDHEAIGESDAITVVGDSSGKVGPVDLDALAASIGCEDQGCPHYGTPHVHSETSDAVAVPSIEPPPVPFAPGDTTATDASIATVDCDACGAPAGILHAPGCAWLMSLPIFGNGNDNAAEPDDNAKLDPEFKQPPTLIKRERPWRKEK